MKLSLSTLVALAGAFALSLSTAQAQPPPSVSFTTSGSPGNLTLDFSVTNNLGGTNDIYFFGVQVDSGRDITGSPTGFNPNSWTSWNNAPYGGSSTNYNNVWIGSSSLLPGNTLSGFDVVTTDLVAPTNVHWFAFATNGTYTGVGNFHSQSNPGFEGVTNASNTSVPEPSACALLGSLGLSGAVWLRRKRVR